MMGRIEEEGSNTVRDFNKNILIILMTIVVGWPSVISLAANSEFQVVDPSEVADILAMMSSVTQANFEKIKTWQGKMSRQGILVLRGNDAAKDLKEITGVELTEDPDEIHRLSDSMIEFKIDVQNNKYFSYRNRPKPSVYQNPKDDTSYISRTGPLQVTEIITPEYQVNISPLTKTKDHVILKRIARKEKPKRTHRSDPRKTFNIGTKSIWLTLSQLSQSLEMTGIETYDIVLKEKTAGSDVVYRIEMSHPRKERAFLIIELSSKVGFNPTYIEHINESNGSMLSKTTMEFVKIQDVFLPRKWDVSQYYPSDGGLMREVVRTIDDMQINLSIPDSTFSEHNYLHDGDKYIDKIKEKKYYKKADKLVEDTE